MCSNTVRKEETRGRCTPPHIICVCEMFLQPGMGRMCSQAYALILWRQAFWLALRQHTGVARESSCEAGGGPSGCRLRVISIRRDAELVCARAMARFSLGLAKTLNGFCTSDRFN